VVAEAIIDQVDALTPQQIDADMAAWTDEEWLEVLDAVEEMKRLGLLPAGEIVPVRPRCAK
jgi:hypothetical protein